MKMIHMQFIPLYFNAKLAKMLVFTKYPQIKKKAAPCAGEEIKKSGRRRKLMSNVMNDKRM